VVIGTWDLIEKSTTTNPTTPTLLSYQLDKFRGVTVTIPLKIRQDTLPRRISVYHSHTTQPPDTPHLHAPLCNHHTIPVVKKWWDEVPVPVSLPSLKSHSAVHTGEKSKIPVSEDFESF